VHIDSVIAPEFYTTDNELVFIWKVLRSANSIKIFRDLSSSLINCLVVTQIPHSTACFPCKPPKTNTKVPPLCSASKIVTKNLHHNATPTPTEDEVQKFPTSLPITGSIISYRIVNAVHFPKQYHLHVRILYVTVKLPVPNGQDDTTWENPENRII